MNEQGFLFSFIIQAVCIISKRLKYQIKKTKPLTESVKRMRRNSHTKSSVMAASIHIHNQLSASIF